MTPPDEDPDTGDDAVFEDLPMLGDLLESVHPDETVEQTLEERFSLPNALGRLEQIREVGDEAFEGTELEMAFANWTGALHGALLRQDYEMGRLHLELARCRYAAGEIGDGELAAAEERYTEALNEFIRFWESFSIAD